VIGLIARGNEMHFVLSGINPFAIYELVTTCEQLLGWDETRIIALVAGLSNKSTEPSRRLAELGRMACERPAVRALVERADASAADRLPQVDAEFARAFSAYLREYGSRSLAFDLRADDCRIPGDGAGLDA